MKEPKSTKPVLFFNQASSEEGGCQQHILWARKILLALVIREGWRMKRLAWACLTLGDEQYSVDVASAASIEIVSNEPESIMWTHLSSASIL